MAAEAILLAHLEHLQPDDVPPRTKVRIFELDSPEELQLVLAAFFIFWRNPYSRRTVLSEVVRDEVLRVMKNRVKSPGTECPFFEDICEALKEYSWSRNSWLNAAIAERIALRHCGDHRLEKLEEDAIRGFLVEAALVESSTLATKRLQELGEYTAEVFDAVTRFIESHAPQWIDPQEIVSDAFISMASGAWTVDDLLQRLPSLARFPRNRGPKQTVSLDAAVGSEVVDDHLHQGNMERVWGDLLRHASKSDEGNLLISRYVDGEPNTEIALRAAVSDDTVKRRQRRILLSYLVELGFEHHLMCQNNSRRLVVAMNSIDRLDKDTRDELGRQVLEFLTELGVIQQS